MVVDIIAAVVLLAILALFRYVWKNRKRPTYAAKRVAQQRSEIIGKRRAAERAWGRK